MSDESNFPQFANTLYKTLSQLATRNSQTFTRKMSYPYYNRSVAHAFAPQQVFVGLANVYIPRMIRERANAQNVASLLASLGVGRLEYIDFVEINGNHGAKEEDGTDKPFIKHPSLVSAYASISFYDKNILDSITRQKEGGAPAYKLYLFRDTKEHWLLLPNENPVERTILNIHQVAHYTAEVQTKTASMETMIQDIMQQNQALIAALEALSKENKEMRSEIDAIKRESKQSETVITVTHNNPPENNTSVTTTTTVATKNRFATSELICGNS